MATERQYKLADKRTTLNHHRIEHEGTVWNLDGKYDPATKTLKVYRVYGDVTKPELLMEALQLQADALGAQITEVGDLKISAGAIRAAREN